MEREGKKRTKIDLNGISWQSLQAKFSYYLRTDIVKIKNITFFEAKVIVHCFIAKNLKLEYTV